VVLEIALDTLGNISKLGSWNCFVEAHAKY
jgi:hypothetical protein